MGLYDRLDKYQTKRVVVICANRKQKYHKTLNKTGIIKNCSSGSEIGVLLDGITNKASSKGLFWFYPYELKFIDEEYENENGGFKMEGNFKIAIVNLLDDYNKKDYGFALFEDASVGDLVVVNPRSTNALGTIKEIVTKEEYGKGVTKEVIGVVSMNAYNERVKERERLVQIEKEKKELQRELDKKISRLKNLEYYEKMAQELKDKDPEIAAMAQKLRDLSA